MSKSIVLDKLNLHPLKSQFQVNKGDIDVNPTINTFNYSNLIPPQFDLAPIAFPNTVTGNQPFSAQKFYSKRTITTEGEKIIAKIPFADNFGDATRIKPYRNGFDCQIFLLYQGNANLSAIVGVKGSIPTTIDPNTNIMTTATNLSLIQETIGDFEVEYLPTNINAQVFTFINDLANPESFFIGRDTQAASFVDNDVDTTSEDFLYIGLRVSEVDTIRPMTIKTLFNYI